MQMAIIEEILTEDEKTAELEQLKKEGNTNFASGSYEKAVELYTKTIEECEDRHTVLRSLLLSNLAAAYIKLEKWEEAAENATKAIEAEVPNDKALERRAFAYSHISNKYEDAVTDYEAFMQKNPSRKDCLVKIADLKKKIEKRNEDLKNDMIDKLKGLGNACLRPFGLSTDSFEMTPNGQGGYSISVKQPTSNSSE